MFIYKVASLIKSLVKSGWQGKEGGEGGRGREENTVKIQQCFKLRGVNHAGQLDSVPYRARRGPGEVRTRALIMKFAAAKKVLKVQKCARRQKSDTRGA